MTEPRQDLANELKSRSMARDAGFSEGDHPRANNGQFGSGGGGGGKKPGFKAPPGMDPMRAKAIAGGAQPNPREVSQMKHREQYPHGLPPLREQVKKAAQAKKPAAFSGFSKEAPYDPAKEGPFDMVGYLAKGKGGGPR